MTAPAPGRRRHFALLAAVSVVALAAGYWLSDARDRPAPPPGGVTLEALIDTPRPPFTLPDETGQARSIAEWDGKLVVLNFWATWCAPCREEIPILISLQSRRAGDGVQVLGIAVDRPEAVAGFAAELGVNYPSLFAEREVIELSRRYGNPYGSLPYTVVIDKRGRVRYAHLGPVEEAELEAVVSRILADG